EGIGPPGRFWSTAFAVTFTRSGTLRLVPTNARRPSAITYEQMTSTIVRDHLLPMHDAMPVQTTPPAAARTKTVITRPCTEMNGDEPCDPGERTNRDVLWDSDRSNAPRVFISEMKLLNATMHPTTIKRIPQPMSPPRRDSRSGESLISSARLKNASSVMI